jgi:hypothetical protein
MIYYITISALIAAFLTYNLNAELKIELNIDRDGFAHIIILTMAFTACLVWWPAVIVFVVTGSTKYRKK